MTLPTTAVTAADGGTASIKDLLINNPTVHWDNFSTRDQLLMLAPPQDLQTSYGGLNFGWWDATGVVRAYAAGDGALFSDVPYVHRGDATFISLVGSIGQLWVAYENAATPPGNNNFPPPASDIWLAKVSCSR
jgi:hypothetical protein